MSAASDEITRLITSSKVFMFSKSYCGFCRKLKSLFKELGIEFNVIELDNVQNGDALQRALVELTGQRTVPNVFVGGKTIGGCDDVHAIHRSGKLLPMIAN